MIVKNELESLLRSKKKIKLYLGLDPTSTLLHLGNAIPLRKLKAFQDLGHHVIFLVGNFTALIGDTSDKDSMRKPLTQSEIDENFKTWKEQASKILDFSKAETVYNKDWLEKLGFKEILELANKFTVQQMIERDMYQDRMSKGKPIGLHEFLYPLMQGYDSVALGVDLELGGNDQLFNMLAGRTLQKVLNNREKHVMTMKLLLGTDGRKMSKSYNNTINIADTPGEQYGKLMSTTDDLILDYFELCTDLPMEEIKSMAAEMKAGGNPRDYKMRLGREIVTIYHGADSAAHAEAEFKKIFQKKDLPSEIAEKELPEASYNIVELVVTAGFAPSKNEARRLVEGGGVKIDGEKITDYKSVIDLKKPHLLQVGKRNFLKVVRR